MSNPNNSNNATENQRSGIISKGLDPVGDVLGKGLSPVGKGVEHLTKPVTGLVGGITKPVLAPVTGSQRERAEVFGGEMAAEDFDKTKPKNGADQESFGGKEQTAQNPLGL